MTQPNTRSEALKIIPSSARGNLLVFLAIAIIPKIKPGTEVIMPYTRDTAAIPARELLYLYGLLLVDVVAMTITMRIPNAMQPATNDTMANAFAAPPP